jgi:hypothetical protein
MALGFFAVYQAFNHYSMYLVSPASYHNNITGVVNLGKLDTWTKLVLASTINVHMAVETTSLVSQLILNHRCRSFAGTYAVLAYTQLVLAVSRVLAHDYFLATDYLFKGLHANHLVEIAIAAVTAYQAATLPRVEQNVIDEQEE